MTWLVPDTQRRAKAIDTTPIRSLLAALEDTYSATTAARQKIDSDLGSAYSPPREQAILNLTRQSYAAIADLQAQIKGQFAAAKVAADQQRADARRDFSTGADGRLYRESLAAYAALAGRMTPDQLAQRLDDALASGLVGEARALADVARTTHEAPSGALLVALNNADTLAKTPYEADADRGYDQIDAAAQRFGVFSLTTDSRLASTLNGRTDQGAGNFSAENVFAAEGGE